MYKAAPAGIVFFLPIIDVYAENVNLRPAQTFSRGHRPPTLFKNPHPPCFSFFKATTSVTPLSNFEVISFQPNVLYRPFFSLSNSFV